jgi:hypothetical protein
MEFLFRPTEKLLDWSMGLRTTRKTHSSRQHLYDKTIIWQDMRVHKLCSKAYYGSVLVSVFTNESNLFSMVRQIENRFFP